MLPRFLALGLFVLAGVASAASVPARSPIFRVATDEPVVAITFDDGPHPTNTARLLEILGREEVRATFFEIGRNVRQHPELARAIVAAGHEIGNHSKTHPKLGDMGDLEAVRAELVETQAIIEEASGRAPTVFRAPFISHGPALWTVLDELRLPSLASRVHIGDWEKDITTERIVERADAAVAGDVILLHTWQERSIEALPEILRRLRAKGLRFVTASELIALQSPTAPAAADADARR